MEYIKSSAKNTTSDWRRNIIVDIVNINGINNIGTISSPMAEISIPKFDKKPAKKNGTSAINSITKKTTHFVLVGLKNSIREFL